MILLSLPGILLIVSFWTHGLGQTLMQENTHILYPELLSDEFITCDCVDMICDSALWFRSTFSNSEVEFIGKFNIAGRSSYGAVNRSQFKFSTRGTSTFVLHVARITAADKGVYSCVLKDKGSTEVWKPGTLLLPGGLWTTGTTPSVVCPCLETYLSQDGCSPLVLWPLVGLVALLAVILSYLLFYFSRLPKKCHHHFVKKRRIT
uniref:Uncharacterized LOC114463735 n=1 Tax=Gouania willdenowi TaxID=441366 RepID=A0A8C5I1D8_GOUWI